MRKMGGKTCPIREQALYRQGRLLSAAVTGAINCRIPASSLLLALAYTLKRNARTLWRFLMPSSDVNAALHDASGFGLATSTKNDCHSDSECSFRCAMKRIALASRSGSPAQYATSASGDTCEATASI